MVPLFLLSLAFGPAWATHANHSDTVRIDNPANAPRTEVVRLEELWRAGGEDAGDVVFGAIGSMIVDREGRVYVADTQANEISVFSANGEFLRNLGRMGEGPGEFQSPRSLVVMPNGSIGVINEEPPRIICFRPADGEYVEDFHFVENPDHPFQRLSQVRCRGKSLVVYGADISQSAEGLQVTGRILRFDTSGAFLGECDSLGFEFNFAKPVVRERNDITWAVGPDERVFINIDRDYDIAVHGREGGAERTIIREYESVKRTTAELDSISEFYRRAGNMGGAKLELFDDARDIAGMWADDAGRLWVLSSRGRIGIPADSLAVFDVFDRNGKLDCAVDVKAERGPNDGYDMDGDRFFVIHRDTMELVAYRMPELKR